MGKKKLEWPVGVTFGSNSSLQIAFTLEGKEIKERIKANPKSQTEINRAAVMRADILKEIEKGTFDYMQWFPKSKRAKQYIKWKGYILTMRHGLQMWKDHYEERLAWSTFDRAKDNVEILMRDLGDYKLSEITPLLIDQYFNRTETFAHIEAPKIKRKRAQELARIIRQVMRRAVSPLGWLPTYQLETYRPTTDAIEDDYDLPKPFTPEEMRAIFTAARPQLRNYIRFALWTGARPSEIIPLQWEDVVDINGVSFIDINKTEVSGHVRKAKGKTKNAIRKIKLLEPAMAAIKAQREFSLLAGEHIFTNPADNCAWHESKKIYNQFRRTVIRAGVKFRKPYMTRHGFCTMMLNAREDKTWISHTMGHADLAMIDRVYGHFQENPNEDYGSNAVEIFG